RMRDIPGASTPVQRVAKRKAAAGKYAPKFQAMWLALYNLGAVEDRTDSAMHAFLERQTSIPHTRFLQVAADAAVVIEPLKAWLIREGVVWPAADRDRLVHLMALKCAILRAQWLRCVDLGAVRSFGPREDCDGLTEYVSAVVYGGSRRLGSLHDTSLGPSDLDSASAALGRKLRAAKAKPMGARHVA
ncbi:MAG: regulatory protein GemA, partial [Roseomonas sp.]|nr:regulatory protein GemA [Roseomonas sp.]